MPRKRKLSSVSGSDVSPGPAKKDHSPSKNKKKKEKPTTKQNISKQRSPRQPKSHSKPSNRLQTSILKYTTTKNSKSEENSENISRQNIRNRYTNEISPRPAVESKKSKVQKTIKSKKKSKMSTIALRIPQQDSSQETEDRENVNEAKRTKPQNKATSISKKKSTKRKTLDKGHGKMTKQFAESEMNKWKLMDKTSQTFLLGFVDTGVSVIMTKLQGADSDVQERLEECRQCFVKTFREMRTPSNNFGDYKTLHRLDMTYTSAIKELTEQEQAIEHALESEETLYEKLQKDLQKQTHRSDREQEIQFHPFLSDDFQSSLEIPPLPRCL